MKTIPAMLLVLVGVSTNALAYNLISDEQGLRYIRWPDTGGGVSEVPWYLNPGSEDSLPTDSEQQAMVRAFNGWEELSCSTIDFVYQGENNATDYNVEDGINIVVFEDPSDQLDTGILAATVTYGGGGVETYNGESFRAITSLDIIFNDGVNFGLHTEVSASDCTNMYDVEAIGLHEIGHGIGFAHSCESDDPCSEADARAAVMYWAVGACDSTKADALADDLLAHSRVYGPNLISTFAASATRVDLATSIDFTVDTFDDATGLSASWDFGDDATSTTYEPSHTYGSQGQYDVELTLSGESASCNGSTFTHRALLRSYVTACGEPTATFGSEIDGKSVRFNGTISGLDIGCVNGVTWDFGDGNSSTSRAPVHEYGDFGTYTVTLTATGLGGTSDFTATVKLEEDKGCGCSLLTDGSRSGRGPGNASTLFGLLALAATMLSRRREIPHIAA